MSLSTHSLNNLFFSYINKQVYSIKQTFKPTGVISWNACNTFASTDYHSNQWASISIQKTKQPKRYLVFKPYFNIISSYNGMFFVLNLTCTFLPSTNFENSITVDDKIPF